MNGLLQRARQANAAHLWLLAGLTLALTPHFVRLPLLLTIPALSLLGWRLLFELRLLPLPPRLVRWLLTLVAVSATYATFHTLFGRQAGVGLLVIMLCLKLMEMDTPRDLSVVTGLGYFVLITVFLSDQSIFIGLYMLLVTSLLTTSLVALRRRQSRIPQHANLRRAGLMLVQAAPIALLLFVLFPRIPGPLWSLPADTTSAGTGLSDRMSPGNISQLSDNEAVAFRVQFEDTLPAPRQRYWRGPVFTRFDGRTWHNPNHRLNNTLNIRVAAASLNYRTHGAPLAYTVTLEPHRQRWLFALDLPAKLPPQSALSADFEIIAHRPVQQLRRYRIRSYPDYQLDAQQPPTMSRYLQLPLDTAPRARRLAAQWRRQMHGDQAIVDRALRHFRDKPFYYTRRPPLLPDDPVDAFLFDSRRGFCEHYASAFVFLMRAAGIPARVVTGYQGGEMNPLGDYFIVRQSDAHAWAEVWLHDQGWSRVDPTAVIPPDRIEHIRDLRRIAPESPRSLAAPPWAKQVWRQLGYGWDNLNYHWNQWVVNYDQQRQRDLLSRFFSRFGWADIDWRGMVSLLLSGVLLVLAVIAAHLLRPYRTRHDPVVAAYRRFCHKLARHDITRAPAEGPLDFARRARARRPDLGPAIAGITSLYQRLRYAPHPPANDLRRLRTAVRRFRP
jgi:transglutaminase-like putative cysteine protease